MDNPENIFLIGFSGSGKSTIGPLLAKELNYEFYDTDSIIEKKTGKSISKIFEINGEVSFRKYELSAIEEIIKKKTINKVVALGAGAFNTDKNRDVILKSGLVIYLKCSAELILKRLADSHNRPLLNSIDRSNRFEKIKQMLSTREPNYKKAHLIISTIGKDSKKMILSILKEIKDYNEKNIG